MQAQQHQINFKPNTIQGNFIESQARADLFSSRMGEGKSTALAWSCLYHSRHNPGANWVLIRDTYENIIQTTQKTFFQWFPPGVCGTYHAGNKTFTWASGLAEGSVGFMGMDDQHDASKLMSREFAGFGIDEPAPAVGSAGVDEIIFDIALSRLRQPGMKWYGAKLAENNPDEAHWTYKRFVANPDEGFRIWQPAMPENILHLPPSYYAGLRKLWAHRPDLIRRFVDGEFGFQSIGKAVTPQWHDKLHLAVGLAPVNRTPLHLCWDFGLNPTCIITQVSPLGHWNVFDCFVGEGIGVEELIEGHVIPTLKQSPKYRDIKFQLNHIGDPAGEAREQSSSQRSAVRVLRRMLPGTWRKGPIKIEERVEPLRSALLRVVGGRGMIQVDREDAAKLWHSLRGGWHHHISRAGIVSGIPVKNVHSHPGDAFAYGAAVLYPLVRRQIGEVPGFKPMDSKGTEGYFGGRDTSTLDLGRKLGATVIPPPAHGSAIR